MISCGESQDSAYDRGYDDGYAVGYNTTCQIRSTLIAGDWDNKHYSRGYADGNSAGTQACLNKNNWIILAYENSLSPIAINP